MSIGKATDYLTYLVERKKYSSRRAIDYTLTAYPKVRIIAHEDGEKASYKVK